MVSGGELLAQRVEWAEARLAKPTGGRHYAPESRMKINMRLGITALAAGLISRSIRRKR